MTGEPRGAQEIDDRRGTAVSRRFQGALIASFAVLAVLIIAVAFWVWSEQAGSMRERAEGNLHAVSELQADEIAAWLEERRSDAEAVRNDPLLAGAAERLVKGAADADTVADLRARLGSLQRDYLYLDVVLASPDGKALLREPADMTHPIGTTAEAAIAEAVRTGRTQSTELYVAEDGDPRLEWVAPLLPEGRHGAAIAAVLLHGDPDAYLYPLLDEWPVPTRSGESVLVERRGDEVLYLSDIEGREDAALRVALPLTQTELPAVQAVLGAHGIISGTTSSGVDVLAAAQPVPGSRWYVVATEDADEVLGPIRQRGWMTAAFALVAVALAGVATLLLWRRRESQVTAALVEREREFSSLFEGMMEGVATHELLRDEAGAPVDYLILDVNPAFTRQTGLAADEARGSRGSELLRDDPPPFLDEFASTVDTGRHTRFEGYVEALDRHLQISVVPQGGERFAAILDDVTGRVERERELRETQERLRFALEKSHTGGWDLDLVDRTAVRTLEHDRIFGYETPLPEWTYERFLEHVVDEDRPAVDASFQRALTEQSDWRFECRIRRADGELRWIRAVGGHQFDEEGSPRRLAGIVQDITAGKLHEQELAASEARFRYLFENAVIGMSMTEPAGRVHVNAAFCRMLGYTPEELAQARWQDLTPHEDLPEIEAELASLLSGEREAARFQKRYLRKDGGIVWADVSVRLRRDEAGEPPHFVTAVLDITQRVEAEQEVARLNAELEQRVADRTAELDAANKELEAFAYSVSHDLRAPLRHVSGFSALLAAHGCEQLDEKNRHYVDRISASVNEMGTLIDDLLAFSRTGRKELAMERVDMDALVSEALAPLRDEVGERPIEWTVAPLPTVTGDVALLRQVWANLLDNAVKYTSGCDPAIIAVGAHEVDHSDVFFVRDNGVGFDMDYAHKLFGVFQRLHSAAEFEGTGIGLANVQRIVSRLGGRAWAEGRVGEGATFYFSLPRRKETSR